MKQDKQAKPYPLLYKSVLLVTLLLAVGLRFAKLDTQSFWNDEGNTARLVERPISLILSGAAGDVHPPGYYLLLRCWRALTGETEFSLRSYSVLCGVITIALTIAIAQHLIKGWKTKSWIMGLPALWFITVHPLSIYYNQETRMYAQLELAAASLLWAAIKFHKSMSQPNPLIPERLTTFILLAGTVALGLYTHYAFIFVVFSISCAYGLYWLFNDFKNWRVLVAWLGAFIVGGLAFIPWVPIALRASGWRPPDLGSVNAVRSLARALVVGITLPEGKAVYIFPVLIIFLVLTSYKLKRAPFVAWASFAMAFIPFLMIVCFGVYRTAYLKFLVISTSALSVCLSVLAVGWLSDIQNIYWRMGLLVCLSVVFTPAQVEALQRLYHDPLYARDDYRGIVTFIETKARTGDAVLLNAPNQWEVFTYYYRGDLPIYTAPYRPTEQDAASWVQGIVEEHPQLFVLYWGETEADPERMIEGELAQQAFKANECWISSIRLARYGTVKTAPLPRDVSNVVFGSDICLTGYELPGVSLYPGEILPLTLVWSAGMTPSERYKVFIHLVNDAGTLIAQTDAEPVGGFYLTNQWMVGEEVIDNYGVLLPDVIEPGQYEVLIGMYDFSGQRLPVKQDGQFIGDYLPLDTVIIESQQ